MVATYADLLIADTIDAEKRCVSFLEQMRARPMDLPTIAILARAAAPSLIQLASETVDDFLLWPTRESELCERIGRLCVDRPQVGAAEELLPELGLLQLVGRDAAFRRLVEQLPRAAAAEAPIVLYGETGSGKELVARAIHYLSRRRSKPFVAVDCGCLPEALFENELFGHRRGAFTDAHRDKRGLVEIAEGGVLFLDEVDSLPLGVQAKLLRFLQERSYRRLGEARSRRADISVIAAANTNLRDLVERDAFRADLYFRLAVLTLSIPPLRRRRADIPLLARHFLETSLPPRATARRVSPAALAKLSRYHWPGNVRELFNVLHRAAVLSVSDQLGPEHIVFDPGRAPDIDRGWKGQSLNDARDEVVAQFEREYIVALLKQSGGNITQAARAAGKERRSFGRLVKKHGIDPKQVT